MQLPPHDPLDTLGLAEGVEVRFKPNLRPDQQRLLGALGVHVIFDEDGYSALDFPHVTDATVAPVEPRVPVCARILGLLADGRERSPADLSRAGCGKRSSVTAELSKMTVRGEIVRVRTGVYRKAP